MKHLKKFLFTALTVFAVFMIGMQEIHTEAALPAVPNDSFNASYSTYSKQVTVEVGEGYDKYEVELYNSNMKLATRDECYSYAFFKVRLNKLYYYRVRGLNYERETGSYVPATEWSAYKAIWTPNKNAVSVKLASKTSKNVLIKVPKVAGIKNYTLYMSSKRDSGYKKVGVIKPGKTKVVSKLKGKTFAYYTNYYYKLVPKVKKAVSTSPVIGYFYISKTYR